MKKRTQQRMKKNIAIALALIWSISMVGQNRGKGGDRSADRQERMENRLEAKKIGYITTELNLTTEEAKTFWPIYDDMGQKIREIKKNAKEDSQRDTDFTEAEADRFLADVFSEEQRVLDIKRDYYKRLETSISKAKIAKLHILERRFRSEIYDSIKRKMKGNAKERVKSEEKEGKN